MYVSRFELKKCWYTVYDNAHCQKMHKTPFENFPQQSWALAHCCKNPQSVSFFNSALQSWALTNTAATTRQIIDYCIMSIFVVATPFLDTETFTCFAFFILLIHCNWSSTTLSRCRCHEAEILSCAQLWCLVPCSYKTSSSSLTIFWTFF